MKKFFILFAIMMILLIINLTYRLFDHEKFMRNHWDTVEKSKLSMIIGTDNSNEADVVLPKEG